MVADSSPTAAELVAMTVTTLKEMCKEKGLKVSGRKQELVDRLLEATASDDDLLILEEDDESPELTLEEEVLEAEVLDSEVEDETFIIPEDEPYEAEILDADIFEAELFEDEEDEINISLAAMDDSLTPQVLNILDEIAKRYSRLKKLQTKRMNSTFNSKTSFSLECSPGINSGFLLKINPVPTLG